MYEYGNEYVNENGDGDEDVNEDGNGRYGTNSKSKSLSLSGSKTMGLGYEKLDVYRPSVMLADSVEKATACRRVPQPAEQNRLQSIPIAISISKMRSPNKRRHGTRLRAFVRLELSHPDFVYFSNANFGLICPLCQRQNITL